MDDSIDIEVEGFLFDHFPADEHFKMRESCEKEIIQLYNRKVLKTVNYKSYNKAIFNELLSFIDGERIICADTKEEQNKKLRVFFNAQGKNQAYDIVEKKIKEILNEKTN